MWGPVIQNPGIRGGKGGVVSKKFVPCLFRPFGPQFGLKIRGGGGAPPGPSPGSGTGYIYEINKITFVFQSIFADKERK